MSKILSIVSPNGDMTSFGYTDGPKVEGEQTIYHTTGTVPNPVPVPPSDCTTKPTGVLLGNGQQLFADGVHFPAFLPGVIQSFELPMDCRVAKVTKMTGTPQAAKWKIFLSKCPGIRDEISLSPNGSQDYNYNGGPIYFTRGTPEPGQCKIPDKACVNFECAVASPAVIQRSA